MPSARGGTDSCAPPVAVQTDDVDGRKPQGWTLTQKTWYDEYTGLQLDPALVQPAVEEELDTFRKHGVYRKVPRAEAFSATGKAPI